ncbi:MAG TPA: sulfur carrier protein ThiS [Thermoanaerobaculaceae bacterium]|nr:sulfur carrier protein ThiS [Acidobacteriota bacterium]NLH12624.1 sulfur carrier protein ThiS [Holophagae bacterium]HPW56997.1 sulfur carrier protein ThiS [Thermoanaerobaculaceae bacterium]
MIRVNDDPLEWHEGMTVRDVIVARNFKFPLLIVTVNGHLVPRPAYDATTVPDDATVRVLHLMSGG